MNPETQRDRRSGLVGVILLRIFAAVLGAAGLIILVGGVALAALGGSLYYAIIGFSIVASAVLLWLRRHLGIRVYGAALAITLAWAIYEVGFDGWGLVPRVLALAILGLWLLMPWTRRALVDVPPAASWRGLTGRLVGGGVASAALGFALHLTLVAPYLAPDPRFQTGMGTFPGQMFASPASGGGSHEWPFFAGDQASSRFSGLAQINRQNVANLKIAWSVDVGAKPGMTSTPIEIGGRIYTCNNNEIFALDAVTGREIWRHDGTKGIEGRCRGVSYYAAPNDAGVCARRILAAIDSNKLIALDAQSGRLCAGFGKEGVVDLLRGMGDADGKIIPGYYQLTSPPVIVRGKAIVGGYVSDNQYFGEPSGVIRAFDAVSGKLAWAWDVGRPDRPNEPPEGENYTHSTPNSWAPMSTDEALGLVYVPMGNPAPDLFGGMRRPFDERVGSAVVALNVDTGREVWAFQTKHHDTWDRDVPSPPTLVDLRGPGGDVRKGLIQATKGGEIFVLDRVTGKPIFPVTEHKVPTNGAVPDEHLSPTQPYSDALPSFRGANLREADMWGISPLDQLFCRIRFKQARYAGPDTPLGLSPSIVYPSMFGATNWGGVSIDPSSSVMIVASNRLASYVRLLPRAEADARGYRPLGKGHEKQLRFGEPMMKTPYGAERSYWLTTLGVPCIAPPYGLLSAVDLNSGKLLWTQRFGTARGSGPLGMNFPLALPMGTPNYGGVLITHGGLLFVGGTPDDFLHAFDVRTGQLLWRTELPGGGNAMPITYEINGEQYVVIAAGGSAAIGSGLSTKMVAFALP